MKGLEEKDKKNVMSLNSSHREDGFKSEKTLIHVEKEEQNKKGEKRLLYDEHSDRWFVLVSYCFCIFCSGFQFVTFIPISNEFSTYYDTSVWKVNMFALINMIVYPFLFIPEGWFIDFKGIKLGLNISSAFILVGSFLTIFVNKDKSLSTCYLGQILSALVRPALLNSPGKIAAKWFNENKRTIICSIGCLSDISGILIGFLWSSAYIKEGDSKEDFEEHMFRYMLSKFILIIILCIPALFVEKDKPDIPPSPSQSKGNLKKQNFGTSLKMLFSNIKFIFLLIATFFFVGYYYSLATSINNLLELYEITRKQSTYIFGFSSFIGVISSVTFSFILDKYKKFKLYMSILCIVGIIFQIFLTFLLEISRTKGLNGYAIGMVFYSLINATVIPFYTLGMNYACEITYPVGESINGGFMMVMTQLFGIIGTFLFDHLIKNNKEKPWVSNLISLIFFVIAAIFTFLLDKKLKRSEIDIEGRLKEEADEKGSKKSDDDNHNQDNQVDVEVKQN